jgi:hypothetical protein
MLFDEKERVFQGPRSYGESDWDYLDRSGRVAAQRVRSFLNEWVSQYPNSDRDDLISRVRSGDHRHFQSATFELVLFALLRALGYSITIHPDLPNDNPNHPDFLVASPQEELFYLEAVTASEYSQADLSARQRANVVLAAIERLDSPNFFLGIDAEGQPETPPNGKGLRRQLERWLTSLDADVVSREISDKGSGVIPKLKWEHDGWRIVFEAIPKKPERRGSGQRIIGVLSGGARWVNTWEPIRDAIKAKGNRYGVLPHPLLIAVNVDAFSSDRIDEMHGLFGQEVFVFRAGDPSATPEMRREPNGAWVGPKGPQYTRISGAWIFDSLNAWNLVSRKNTLYFNPWAERELPESLTVLNHAKVEKERMVWVTSRSLGEILNLPAEWPR